VNFPLPRVGGVRHKQVGTIKLDETKTPKEMDAISTEKEVMLGIYALDEGGLQGVLRPRPVKPRPTALGSSPGGATSSRSGRRQKNH